MLGSMRVQPYASESIGILVYTSVVSRVGTIMHAADYA